jgi:hypothetical protein
MSEGLANRSEKALLSIMIEIPECFAPLQFSWGYPPPPPSVAVLWGCRGPSSKAKRAAIHGAESLPGWQMGSQPRELKARAGKKSANDG